MGTQVFVEMFIPPKDATPIYVVGKQWMWKVQHPAGAERDQRDPPAAGPAGQADHDLAGRDPQLLHPGVPDEAGCRAGPLDLGVVPAQQGRPLSPVLRRVLRDRALEDGRLGRGDGAERTSRSGSKGRPTAAAAAAATPGRRWPRPAPGSSRNTTAPAATGPTPSSGHPSSTASTAARCRSWRANGKDVEFVTADDRYIRDSILLPKSQVVAGYDPVMPSYKDVLKEEELLQIMEYIKSIGRKEGVR